MRAISLTDDVMGPEENRADRATQAGHYALVFVHESSHARRGFDHDQDQSYLQKISHGVHPKASPREFGNIPSPAPGE
jgi:hypothetical protein